MLHRPLPPPRPKADPSPTLTAALPGAGAHKPPQGLLAGGHMDEVGAVEQPQARLGPSLVANLGGVGASVITDCMQIKQQAWQNFQWIVMSTS